MSKHEAKVIKVMCIEKHPNADALQIVTVGGYVTCTRLGDFATGELAVFIEPDTIVDTNQPEFAFLKKENSDKVRIKAKKLRGVSSFGLLIKARPEWNEGVDVFEILNCEHYEPYVPNEKTGGLCASPPEVPFVFYDVENYKRHLDLLEEGEIVSISEKLHGSSARFVYTGGELHVGSHRTWKKTDDANIWVTAANKYDLSTKLAKYPDYVFYGEVFGRVQDLRYGATNDDPLSFAVFDIMYKGSWLSVCQVEAICKELHLPLVPELYFGPWHKGLVNLANGKSTWPGADHIREGCVVKPSHPRCDKEIGRVILKIISVDYYNR
jgi:RNA ligase (TIGR02306 family)